MKLIQLPNDGPAVKASSILRVSTVFECGSQWRYDITYELLAGEAVEHSVMLDNKYINDENKANITRSAFLSNLNELL